MNLLAVSIICNQEFQNKIIMSKKIILGFSKLSIHPANY